MRVPVFRAVDQDLEASDRTSFLILDMSTRPTDIEASAEPTTLERAQLWLQSLVNTFVWKCVVSLIIVVNIAVLGAEHYYWDPEFGAVQWPVQSNDPTALDVINDVCTILFLVEIVVKLAAFGPRTFIRDVFNIVDVVVVAFSLVDFFKRGDLESSRAVQVPPPPPQPHVDVNNL